MLSFIRRRVLMALLVVLSVTILLTLLVQLIPGDPVTAIVGPRASPGLIARVQTEMGLDRSVPMQVLIFLGDVVQGDLGRDFVSNASVSSLVAGVLPHTLLLAVAALMIAVALGVPLGVYAATHQDSAVDKLLAVISIGLTTMPAYVAGLLLLLLFSVKLQIFPTVGAGDPAYPADYVLHLVLPAAALGLPWVGYVARLLRGSMIEALSSNYVRSAQAFGISSPLLQYKFALRNAVIPTVTVLGVGLGNLIGGAIFVEVIFARPGLGVLIYDAITARNFPVLRGGVLVVVVLFVLANLAAELLQRALDPRTRQVATAGRIA